MELTDEPEELISPPETRLVGTLITQKPNNKSFLVSFSFILFTTLITQFYWADPFNLSQYLPVVNYQLFTNHQWWRAFTAVFIHGDLGHLLSNMYMLGILCFFVYGYFGFLIFPVYTLLGSALVNVLAVYTYPPDLRLLGASGLVYLLGGFWLTLYFFIQRQYSRSSRLLRVFGIGLMIFFPTSFEATTSYRTHFIGFTMGIAMALIYFFLNKKKIRSHEVFKTFGAEYKSWN